MKVINIAEKFSQFSQQWHPHTIASANDMLVCVAKLEGEFVWHSHENEDELFLVLNGTLIMQFEDHQKTLNPGEMIVVPKGVSHCPKTLNGEVEVLLFEKNTVKHTGSTTTERSVNFFPKL